MEEREEREQIKTMPRSFRISEEVNEKLKSISNQIGGNQQDLFDQLISAYESRQVEETLGPRKEDYAAVVKLLDTVKSKYISAVLEADNADEIANAKYEKELRNREKTIIAQQDKIGSQEERIRQQEQQLNGITGLREDVKIKREECEKLTKENDSLKESIRQLEEEVHNLKTTEIDQKNSLSTVRSAYSELQLDYRNDKETINYLQTENRNLTNKCDMLQKADDASRQQLTQQIEKELRAKLAAEYAEKEKEYVLKMNETMNTYRQQADAYKDKYIDLLERRNEK